MLEFFLMYLAGVWVGSILIAIFNLARGRRRIVIDPTDAADWERITAGHLNSLRHTSPPPIVVVDRSGKVSGLIDRERT